MDMWQKKTNVSTVLPITEEDPRALAALFERPVPALPRYTERLEKEYSLIEKNKFTRVFQQVKRILVLIRQIGEESGRTIPFIIRGSAGSSLICFLMGITHIDPILYNIELARFMNDNRQDMPDIDIDVPYNRREEIYASITEEWKNQVARISNHVMWKPKSALRDATKVWLKEHPTEHTPELLRKVARKRFDVGKLVGGDAETLQIIRQSAKDKIGTQRTYSQHCGGIVIFEKEGAVPKDLILKPITAAGKSLQQIKLNKDETEDAGFIKIDILSNRGLAQLADICPDRPLTAYQKRDARTEALLARGDLLGVTFAESRGMRKIFMEMKPQRMEDVAIALALIRPAAAAEGRKQSFLEKWKLARATARDNALMRPIVYDDDAIQKIQAALQCTTAEADIWRKMFAKGHAHAASGFREALQSRGHSLSIQNMLIDDLQQLVYYSFCKSHAFSYAQLVWALAYWKAHHPHAFWCAALNHCHSEYRKWVHHREAKASGIHLSRCPGPYKLSQRNGEPCLIPVEGGEQTTLGDDELDKTAVQQIRQLGYWLREDFLPACGVWPDAQQRLDGRQAVHFRGIIATGRVIRRDFGVCTLVCIGTGNRQYMDLVLSQKERGDLFSYAVLEGTGTMDKPGQIDVKSIRGVSLKRLLKAPE
jgi:error-prone DNA polymerase